MNTCRRGLQLKYGKRDFIYLHKQEAEHFVASCGIDFFSFMQSLKESPQNVLLLDHPFMDVEYDMHTQFNYITFPSYKKYYKENGKEYGHISWIDFEDIEGVEELAPWEIAEILYVRHTFNHLRSPFYQKLDNRFVYLTLEDGFYNKIYYRNWNDFYQVISKLIPENVEMTKPDRLWLGGKKKLENTIIPLNIIKQLSKVFNEGAIISFQKSTQNRQMIEIPIWTVGDYRHEDEIRDELRSIYQQRQTVNLVYHKKMKEWLIEEK